MRTRGWWTEEPREVADVVEARGRLVVGEGGELMVELPDEDAVERLREDLANRFEDRILLSP